MWRHVTSFQSGRLVRDSCSFLGNMPRYLLIIQIDLGSYVQYANMHTGCRFMLETPFLRFCAGRSSIPFFTIWGLSKIVVPHKTIGASPENLRMSHPFNIGGVSNGHFGVSLFWESTVLFYAMHDINYRMSRRDIHFRSDQFGFFPDRICWYRRCITTGFMRRLLRKRIMSFSSTHNGKSRGFCCTQITSWQGKIAAFQWRFLIFNRKYSGETKIYIYPTYSISVFIYIYHKKIANVGKYTIHWVSEYTFTWSIFQLLFGGPLQLPTSKQSTIRSTCPRIWSMNSMPTWWLVNLPPP